MKKLLVLTLALVAGVARATVPTSTGVVGPYACDGVTTAFPVPFRFLEASHLVVTRTTGGTTTTLTLTTDYTVSGAGAASGTVTLVAASRCPAATTLTIRRVVPITQPTSFRSQATPSPAAIEAAVDRVTMLAQQLNDLYGPIAAATVGPAGPPGSISAVGSDINLGNAYKVVNSAEPTGPQDAATKNYVDTQLTAGLAPKAPLAGPTFTGTVTVPTLTVNTTATVPTPTLSGHAATKAFVDYRAPGRLRVVADSSTSTSSTSGVPTNLTWTSSALEAEPYECTLFLYTSNTTYAAQVALSGGALDQTTWVPTAAGGIQIQAQTASGTYTTATSSLAGIVTMKVYGITQDLAATYTLSVKASNAAATVAVRGESYCVVGYPRDY